MEHKKEKGCVWDRLCLGVRHMGYAVYERRQWSASRKSQTPYIQYVESRVHGTPNLNGDYCLLTSITAKSTGLQLRIK